jgi:hypothetical protein
MTTVAWAAPVNNTDPVSALSALRPANMFDPINMHPLDPGESQDVLDRHTGSLLVTQQAVDLASYRRNTTSSNAQVNY